jgi:DNA-binding CsgD family transcriptional regulator
VPTDAAALGSPRTEPRPARGAAARGPQAAVLVVDDDRRCVEASLGACRLLGAGRDEVEGRLLETLFTPAMGARLDHFWQAFGDSGGQAGPFAVASATAPVGHVRIALTANVLPGRHVVTLEPEVPASGEADGNGHGTGAAPPRTPTARECQILALLAEGATDGQIARHLQLAPATVQTHVRNAKAKLGARTRAQAVAMALRQGIIVPE